MRALITGGTGFIGNNLARLLVKKGCEVGLILREESKDWRIKDILEKVTQLKADLTNKEEIERAIDAFQPNVIYHLAAYGAYLRTQKSVNLMIDTNIKGTINLVEAAGQIPLINAGSSSEYGIKDAPMNETDVCIPDNNYGLTKLAQTLYCAGEKIPTLRISSAYGPFEDTNRLIPTLILAKLCGSHLKLINSVRDYVYAEDIANAFVKASERFDQIRGEIINVGSGVQTSVKELLQIIDNLNHKSLKVSWNFEPAQTEPTTWVLNIEKARRLLNWAPAYDLMDGLKRSYDWWKNELENKTRAGKNIV